MDPETAPAFLTKHHHAVLATRRRNGDLQMSPVTAGVDGAGRVTVSSRETAYKARNLRRDPRASLCVFADAFHGSVWMQLNGRAQIISLPDAMELLVDHYRRVYGEHADWSQYREKMERERRVLIRVVIESAGPDKKG